jgi:hypothetical protein
LYALIIRNDGSRNCTVIVAYSLIDKRDQLISACSRQSVAKNIVGEENVRHAEEINVPHTYGADRCRGYI